jgi:hypothetical protein
MYGERSWIAQIEGKKYYLKNLPEEEKAAKAIANMLRYGVKSDEEVDGDFDAPTETPFTEETPPTEETPTEETPPEA